MRRTLTLLLFGTLCLSGAAFARKPVQTTKPSSEAAQEPLLADTERYKSAISDSRKKLFEDSMSDLAPASKEIFWATYKDYEIEKNQIARERTDLLKRFTDAFASEKGPSDDDITEAINKLVQLQQENVDVRMKYFGILGQKIDVRTAGRFALVDDYITTSMRLEWLNQIPFPGDAKK